MKPRDDLQRAILEHVIRRREDGYEIIGSESTGRLDPWIFDFRALMLQPMWLDRFAEIFWEEFGDRLPFQVGAMESAGISLVAAIVMKSKERGTPVHGFFIRKSRKRIGLTKQIEGAPTGEPVVLVDDLVNSGGTFDKQIKILEDAGLRVRDLFALVRFREHGAYERYAAHGITLKTLFALSDFGIEMRTSPAQKAGAGFDEVWRFRGPDVGWHTVVHTSTPVLDQERLYVGHTDGTFRAIYKATGALAWERAIGTHPFGKGILSSPALHGNVVYFGAYDGNVYALDAKTGAVRWIYRDADWVGSSPSIDAGRGVLYIGLEYGLVGRRGGVVALSLSDGAERWHRTLPSLTHGSPLYVREHDMVVIGSNDGVLYAFDAKTGDARFRTPTGGDIKMRPAYDAVSDRIVVASMRGAVYSLSPRDGSPVFAYDVGTSFYATPLVHQGVIYAASLDKRLYAIDALRGSKRFAFETGGRIFSSPTLFDGSLWIGSNDGRLYEIDPETGVLRGYFQAPERILSAPVFDERDSAIYVATHGNDVYRLRRQPGQIRRQDS